MQAPTAPAVGILWRVADCLVLDRSVLAEAEPYGDCLTHPGGHYERWEAWQTTTVTTGLRASGITAPWLLGGAMNGQAFRTYVADVLAPTLQPGDAVVMDNLPTHKVSGIREKIEAVGAWLLYLPAYSI